MLHFCGTLSCVFAKSERLPTLGVIGEAIGFLINKALTGRSLRVGRSACTKLSALGRIQRAPINNLEFNSRRTAMWIIPYVARQIVYTW